MRPVRYNAYNVAASLDGFTLRLIASRVYRTAITAVRYGVDRS